MNPTIKDVARRANVSIATVSRILNNLPGYSEETRKKVLQVINETGYQPNAIARGLINKRTRTIGVLFPTVSSMFSSEILDGIEQFAHNHDYSVIVCNTDADGKRTLKYLQVLGEKQVDGIIFSSGNLKDEYYQTIKSMAIPLVLVSTISQRFSVPYVKVDDRLASYQATEYLIKKGHKQIGMISGTKEDLIAGVPRVEGFLQALNDYGIPHRSECLVYGGFDFNSGCKVVKELLRNAPDTTAVFAASDEMAAATISVASKQGIRVPEQLSVIGYDNLKLAQMTVPPLTTVEQPLFEMGRIAAEQLLTMIETGKDTGSRIVPHSIIERKTVRSLLE
ncbi:LacI family transcriptional regulator [Paenibacillus sp. SYP-B3998]|uniref:LacI family transcriptional regulator n=1 Tax=Paenibacillus sp. SYP-B3998 TaxID=2678564 RepID=A0A6G4A6E4_9BACL|nr:substrate-binding domain-containing protein [Paenibacillus sp. SYP-B3998]NEW09514.1 LacI family transcriptional regulator [Paenibacillus sp. SYP-B3998]